MHGIKPNQAVGGLIVLVGLWLLLDTGTNDPTMGFLVLLVGAGVMFGQQAFLTVVRILKTGETTEECSTDAADGDEETGEGTPDTDSETPTDEPIPDGRSGT